MVNFALFVRFLRNEDLACRDQTDVFALWERFVVENTHQLSACVLPIRIGFHYACVDILSHQLNLSLLGFQNRLVVLTGLLSNVETRLLEPLNRYDVALDLKR